MTCELCKSKTDCISSLIEGKYYKHICSSCVHNQQGDFSVSSGFQGFDRRRQYEDLAQETVQPYTASGPNPEFYRLYPKSAAKVFTPAEIEQVKRKL